MAFDSWKRSTVFGRRVGLILGLAGVCFVAIGSALRQEVIAMIAAPPGILLWSALAMRLASRAGRQRGAETTL